jgi:hypothetical protein
LNSASIFYGILLLKESLNNLVVLNTGMGDSGGGLSSYFFNKIPVVIIAGLFLFLGASPLINDPSLRDVSGSDLIIGDGQNHLDNLDGNYDDKVVSARAKTELGSAISSGVLMPKDGIINSSLVFSGAYVTVKETTHYLHDTDWVGVEPDSYYLPDQYNVTFTFVNESGCWISGLGQMFAPNWSDRFINWTEVNSLGFTMNPITEQAWKYYVDNYLTTPERWVEFTYLGETTIDTSYGQYAVKDYLLHEEEHLTNVYQSPYWYLAYSNYVGYYHFYYGIDNGYFYKVTSDVFRESLAAKTDPYDPNPIEHPYNLFHYFEESSTIASNIPWIFPQTPGQPKDPHAIGWNNTIDLSWDPPTTSGGAPITKYCIYRDLLPEVAVDGAPIAEVTNYQKTDAVNYQDNDVENGVIYYYRITAVNSLGEGPPSEEVWAYPSELHPIPDGGIMIYQPQEGSLWPISTQQKIVWKSDETNSPTVKIECYNETSSIVINPSVPNGYGGNSYFWTIPHDLDSKSWYKIRISSSDSSSDSGKFYVGGLRVITPNGGEKLTMGELFPIKWTSSDVGLVRIDIVDASDNKVIYSWTSKNNGSWIWQVPEIDPKYYAGDLNDWLTGNFYVKITNTGTSENDRSDYTFTFQKKWTILAFLNGDNNMEAATETSLTNLESVRSSINFNTLVQIDRLSSATTRMFCGPDGDEYYPKSLGDVDMGNSATLADFLQWGVSNFPSEEYILIIGGHGNGFDIGPDNHAGESVLTSAEIRAAISAAGMTFSDIILDSCLMSTIETAYELKASTQYLMCSQSMIDFSGFDYYPMLSAINDSPDIDARDIGSILVNAYQAAYSVKKDAQVSCISMAGIVSLASDIDAFAIELEKECSISQTSFLLKVVNDYRTNSKSFGKSDYNRACTNFVDLYDLALRVQRDSPNNPSLKEAATQVVASIGQVVPYYYPQYNAIVDGRNWKSRGISIFFPDCVHDYHDMYILNPRFDGLSFTTESKWYTDTNFLWTFEYCLTRAEAPSNIMVEPGDGALYVSWNAPPGVVGEFDHYEVRIRTVTEQMDLPALETTNTNKVIDGLTNGEGYIVKVSMVTKPAFPELSSHEVVVGWWSSQILAKPGTATAPIELKCESNEDGNSLSWKPPSSDGGSGVTEYNVYRAGGSTGSAGFYNDYASTLRDMSFTKIATVTNTSYLDRDVIEGITYHYRICAVNANGESFMASEVNVTALFTPSSNSDLIELLSNPLLIGGVLALVAIIAIAIVVMRRRK